MPNREIVPLQVKRLKKIKKIVMGDEAEEKITLGPVRGAIDFVWDDFKQGGRNDFFEKPGCALLDVCHRRNYDICTRCVKWDNLNARCLST